MITWPYHKIEMGAWMPLLGSGIGIAFTPGATLKAVLCEELIIPERYLEHRIQTILVNSRAIDDPEHVQIAHGDTVALSAAMPGLVGTTLRRGSHLAAMRSDITLNSEAKSATVRPVSILTLKLFNMVAAELGPGILTGRIYINGRDLAYLRRHYPALAGPKIATGPNDWIEIDLPEGD